MHQEKNREDDGEKKRDERWETRGCNQRSALRDPSSLFWFNLHFSLPLLIPYTLSSLFRFTVERISCMNNSTCKEKKHQTRRQEQVFSLWSSSFLESTVTSSATSFNVSTALFFSCPDFQEETKKSDWQTSCEGSKSCERRKWRQPTQSIQNDCVTCYVSLLFLLLVLSCLINSSVDPFGSYIPFDASLSFPGTDLKMQWTWKVVSQMLKRRVWRRKSSLRPPSPQDFPPVIFLSYSPELQLSFTLFCVWWCRIKCINNINAFTLKKKKMGRRMVSSLFHVNEAVHFWLISFFRLWNESEMLMICVAKFAIDSRCISRKGRGWEEEEKKRRRRGAPAQNSFSKGSHRKKGRAFQVRHLAPPQSSS